MRKRFQLSLFRIQTTWDTLQSHSFTIPYHMIFLKPPGSLTYPCQQKRPYIFVSSSSSFSSVDIKPNSRLKSKSLAPPLRPSWRTSTTLEIQFFVHFQAFHRVWRTHRHHHRCSEDNCSTSLLSFPRPLDSMQSLVCYRSTHTFRVPNWECPRIWSLGQTGLQECFCVCSKHNIFSLMTSMSADVPINID